MTDSKAKVQKCICSRQGCWRDDEHQIPVYCQASQFREEAEREV
jgi:hypothetical protein